MKFMLIGLLCMFLSMPMAALAQRDASTSSARAAYSMPSWSSTTKAKKKTKAKKVKAKKSRPAKSQDAARARRRSLNF